MHSEKDKRLSVPDAVVSQPEGTRDRFDDFADEVAFRIRLLTPTTGNPSSRLPGFNDKDLAFVARQWFGNVSEPIVDEEFVAEVESAIGMGHGAWDMENPIEICRNVLVVAASRTTASPTPVVSGQADKCAFCIRDSETNCDACGRKICGNHRTIGYECDFCPECKPPEKSAREFFVRELKREPRGPMDDGYINFAEAFYKSAPPSLPKAGEAELVRCNFVYLDGWHCVKEVGHEGSRSAAIQNIPTQAKRNADHSVPYKEPAAAPPLLPAQPVNCDWRHHLLTDNLHGYDQGDGDGFCKYCRVCQVVTTQAIKEI